MGVRTRSATSSPVKASGSVSRHDSTINEPQHATPKVLIVPRSVSAESRILELKHPRDGRLTKFLFCPQTGLFEFTQVTAETLDPRSILFCQPDMDANASDGTRKVENRLSAGYVNESADILTATPFDISFVLLSKLASEGVSTKKAMFQPLDDLLDIPESEDKHLRYILKHAEPIVQAAMVNICDSIDAGDERLYRFSEDKVLRLWLDRAQRVVERGLPSSIEERFVTRALEAPVLSIKREESTVELPVLIEGQDHPASEGGDSQSTVTSTTASIVFSEVSETSSTTTVADDASVNDVRKLLRLRVALNFISATCLPQRIGVRLQEKLTAEEAPVSFKSLDDELVRIATLRAEAHASRSFTDFTRKRTSADDDEAAEIRAEKKRKLEEDEKKRKANESRGVRDLKKVNVSGMKKMSDFFSKKPAVAKTKT